MNEAGRIFRRELWKVSVRMKGILCYLSWHYTWVSVIVLGFVGTVLILIFCSCFRWNHYDLEEEGRNQNRDVLDHFECG